MGSAIFTFFSRLFTYAKIYNERLLSLMRNESFIRNTSNLNFSQYYHHNHHYQKNLSENVESLIPQNHSKINQNNYSDSKSYEKNYNETSSIGLTIKKTHDYLYYVQLPEGW
jgi:hypothetical protein